MQDNLILLRKNNFVTQKKLANLLGISEVQYGKKEKGIAAFTQDEMFIISDYFKMSFDNIFFKYIYPLITAGISFALSLLLD